MVQDENGNYVAKIASDPDGKYILKIPNLDLLRDGHKTLQRVYDTIEDWAQANPQFYEASETLKELLNMAQLRQDISIPKKLNYEDEIQVKNVDPYRAAGYLLNRNGYIPTNHAVREISFGDNSAIYITLDAANLDPIFSMAPWVADATKHWIARLFEEWGKSTNNEDVGNHLANEIKAIKIEIKKESLDTE